MTPIIDLQQQSGIFDAASFFAAGSPFSGVSTAAMLAGGAISPDTVASSAKSGDSGFNQTGNLNYGSSGGGIVEALFPIAAVGAVAFVVVKMVGK